MFSNPPQHANVPSALSAQKCLQPASTFTNPLVWLSWSTITARLSRSRSEIRVGIYLDDQVGRHQRYGSLVPVDGG